MTIASRKSCSLGLLCLSIKKVSIFVCALFPFGFYMGGMWDLIVLAPDHCLSFILLIVAYKIGQRQSYALCSSAIAHTYLVNTIVSF